MGGFLASFFRRKSDNQFGLLFSVCQPSILQNLGGYSRRAGETQVHGYDTGACKVNRSQECYTGQERRRTELSFTENLRVFRWPKSRYNITTEWRISSDFQEFFVFCSYDNEETGAELYSCPLPEVDRVIRLA